MKKALVFFLILLFSAGAIFAGSISLEYKGFSFSYSWESDRSVADDNQVRQAIQQGFREGFEDGVKDRDNSSTTHYGDSYSQWSYSNSYVQDRYHDAYMEGYKKGAGKPPSIDDTIWW